MKKIFFSIVFILLASILQLQAKQIQVNVLSLSFSPKTFTARIGDTIHFVWVAGTHTTTSTSVPSGASTWNSPSDATHTSFFYVIKVAGSYAYQCNFHVAMGMVGSFTVPFQAKISTIKTVSVNSCTSTNSIQYKCTKSKPPYKVQLYRYGQAFNSVKTVSDTFPFTFSSLPNGSYYATVKGNNGADTLVGKSGTSILMPVPTSVRAIHITGTKATIKWSHYSCVKFYAVQYRKKGVTTWTKTNTSGNKDSINLSNLTLSTKYQFQVASVDSAHKITATGKYSAIDSFKTAVSAITPNQTDLQEKAMVDRTTENDEAVIVFPNPASAYIKIQTKNNSFVSAMLRSIDGKVVWSELNCTIMLQEREFNISVSNLPNGIYFLQLVDLKNKSIIKKIIVAK